MCVCVRVRVYTLCVCVCVCVRARVRARRVPRVSTSVLGGVVKKWGIQPVCRMYHTCQFVVACSLNDLSVVCVFSLFHVHDISS